MKKRNKYVWCGSGGRPQNMARWPVTHWSLLYLDGLSWRSWSLWHHCIGIGRFDIEITTLPLKVCNEKLILCNFLNDCCVIYGPIDIKSWPKIFHSSIRSHGFLSLYIMILCLHVWCSFWDCLSFARMWSPNMIVFSVREVIPIWKKYCHMKSPNVKSPNSNTLQT